VTAAVVARSLRLLRESNVALEESDLEIPGACVTALIGPNGSGKSTLLDAIAGLTSPSGGSLDVRTSGARGAVAYVLQATRRADFLPISVREVVTMGRYARRGLLGRLDEPDRAAIDAALERLELAPLASRPLGELSGGERQRVLVAQGVAQEAEILLLDEPVTGLDVVSRQRILAAIDDEIAAGRTVITSTHDLGDAAGAEHVVLLANRVIAQGAPSEVITEAMLALAYGGRIFQTAHGSLFFDDAHHDHGGGPHRTGAG
jgi:manganese transport system ATP-binding protein